MKSRVKIPAMIGIVFLAISVAIFGSVPSVSGAALNQSSYLELSSDYAVGSSATILSQSITFSESTKVYLQSDGRYFPSNGGATACMTLKVDGNPVGNSAVIQWNGSTNMMQHCYNCIAGVTVAAGTHTFSLSADTLYGTGFTVGAGSNLCIMANPADTMQVATLSADSGTFNFTTYGIVEGQAVPHTPILSCAVNNSAGPIIALGSVRAYGSGGDAMFRIYRDGSSIANNEGTWSVNDLFSGAEFQAPCYTQAFMNTTGSHTISLDASEFTWGNSENGALYNVGAGSELICLYGGMTVAGSAALSTNYDRCCEWIDIGTGTNYELVSTTVTIPQGHNGVVLFSTKNRIQCDPTDTGGSVRLWINIDGVDKVFGGVQQLAYPNGESQRTLCASYLAAGSNALSAGTHTVKVYARADGSFLHPCMLKDLPLIWFD